MPDFTDLTGLASVASASTAAVLLLPGISRLPARGRVVLLGAVFVAMPIPFGELPLAAYLRGVTGELSITTLVLSWCVLLMPWFRCSADDSKTRRALLMLVALAALVLYPLALGAAAFDSYRMGYGDAQFVAVLLLAALAAWIWNYYLVALCIAFAILAWTVGWYESSNLWDYLLDPWIAIYALLVNAMYGVRMLFQWGKAQETR
jgi:hypothetical protein